VPGSPELEAERRKSASTTEEYLVGITQAVDRLRKIFQTGYERGPRPTKQLRYTWSPHAAVSALGSGAHTHRGASRKRAVSLGAAGIYRNAAVAFRSLADVDGDQRLARSDACAKLLQHGDRHVETFVAAMAKKPGDATP
jgi:hypothetical protein